MNRDIRSFLKENILLFDGAMGTYLAAKDRALRNEVELANLTAPEKILDIHEEYLEAGATAITTNTFGANRQNYPDNWERIIDEGYRLASEAASKHDAYVFADIGPMEFEESANAAEEYIRIAERFLKNGAKHFIFETQSMSDGILEAAEFIRSVNNQAFIIASFAVMPDGFTKDGEFASKLAKTIGSCPYIDAFGLNCMQDALHMKDLVKPLRYGDKYLCLMPNAGYPTVLGRRVFYKGDPAFFARNVAELALCGASILGGCCGTTPDHIRLLKQALPAKVQANPTITNKEEQIRDTVISPFWESLKDRQKKTIAVELDPPENASLDKFMDGSRRLQKAGIDAITVADCPIGRARMDSSLLSCKLKRELDMDVLPHLTCRDRNLNATKALLLGLYAEKVRNVLLVTGDPVPSAQRDEVRSVYQFNSRKLASFVDELGKQVLGGGFHIFGALNVNARNFDVQLKLAQQKIDNGMKGFLTQPILSENALKNLEKARETLDAYILGGLIPIVSERNARYMDSEVNGMTVDPQIIRAYEGKDRAQAEALAVEITTKTAKDMKELVDGYYLITPFSRISLMERIIAQIQAL